VKDFDEVDQRRVYGCSSGIYIIAVELSTNSLPLDPAIFNRKDDLPF
jgi:hypothetical protein